ncbi:MAG TPA: 50S ribosomal protein L35 [Gaiellaceae bacterium]|nr:50S ribosomal protein L35 [Gaiellaceae bacterium]
MPKQKTSSAAKKRFKVTGSGKILRRHAMQSHNLEHKSAKRKRAFGRDEAVHKSDAREARKLLGRGS